MEEWKKVRLGNIVKINKNTYSVKENWNYVNYLDTGNIVKNMISKIQHIDLSKEKLPSRAKRKVCYNSIIYSTVRPNQLHYGIIKEQPKNFLVSTGFTVIDVNIEVANADFIYYILTQNDVIEHLQAIGEQSVSAYPSIKSSDIEELEIMLPSLSEQRKIVGILSSIDKNINNNNKINNNLEQQAQELFKSWFIDAPESSSWESGTFSDIIDTMIAGDWGKDSPTSNNTERVYCIRGADIPDVKSGNKGKMPTRFILPKNYAAKHLVDGDVVVEISGGSPTQSTGRIASISQSLLDRYDKGMVCTNFCKAMKPKLGYSMFVYYYWQYLYDKKVFFLYENGTTGIKNLDISGFIETAPIVLPPAELVEKFDTFCHSVFDVIFANGLQNEQLVNMRNALLPKLMSNELDVSNLDI